MESCIFMLAAEAAVFISLWAYCKGEWLAISQAARRAEPEVWWEQGYPDPTDHALGVYDGQ